MSFRIKASHPNAQINPTEESETTYTYDPKTKKVVETTTSTQTKPSSNTDSQVTSSSSKGMAVRTTNVSQEDYY